MIRRACATDAPAIAAIWNHIIRDTVATFTTVEKDPAAIADTMDTHPFWVAEMAGAVAGFATCFQSGPGRAMPIRWSIRFTSPPPRRARGLAVP